MNSFHRLCSHIVSLLVLFFLIVATPHPTSAFTLVKNSRPACAIILAEKMTPPEQHAAEELVSTLERISGARIPVMPEGTLPEAGNYLLLGRGAWFELPRFRRCAETLDIVGEQGYVIEPVTYGKIESLAVAGGSPRTTAYAVHELLRKAGVRWYTADAVRAPRRRNIDLPSKETADFPCFTYRGILSGGPDTAADWNEHLRLNAGEGIPLDRLSGSAAEHIPLEVPLRELLPGALFASHPEYFPLVGGSRTDAYGLCCFSRPEAAALIAGGIIARLERTPEITHVIPRFDSPGVVCRCPSCERTIQREGAAGLALLWLNSIAEQVARTRRNVFLTLSEPWTLGPVPKTVRPRGDVVVLLDSGGYPGNQAFTIAVQQWSAVSGRVHLALPFIPKDGDSLPFRGLSNLAEDLVRCRDSDVEGIFFKPPVEGMLAVDTELRLWVFSELLWNADLDVEMLIQEWLKGVCGSAAAPLAEYREHIGKLAGKTAAGETGGIPGIDDTWLDAAERMLQRAYALSLSDKAANRQVRRMRLGLWRLRLEQVCHALQEGKPPDASARTKYGELLDKFVQDSREFGFSRISRGEDVDDFARRVRGALRDGYRR
ncbi:MAG: DUF4838 domain-containing protein [Candidatus Latescibacterota bacterium]